MRSGTIESLLVTGATGLVGSNACLLAAARGIRVRALARPGGNTRVLSEAGVEIIRGDITERGAIEEAVEGASHVVHAAALLGGTWAEHSDEAFEAVNHRATRDLIEATDRSQARLALISTTAILDRGAGRPIDELTPLSRSRAGEDRYVTSKREAFVAMQEAAQAGRWVVSIFPGGVYGPSPLIDRALAPTSFNGAILLALNGDLSRYPPVKLGWVTASNVAAVSLAALAGGRSGQRYLAMGHPGDAMTVPEFLSRFSLAAGQGNAVRPTGSPELEPELLDEFGEMARVADTNWPEPLFDPTVTEAELKIEPVRLEQGIDQTLDWMRNAERIP